VRQGNLRAVVALLDGGAKINELSTGDKTSPLMMATVNGQFDVAMYLLSRGADPNSTTTRGDTPLFSTINSQWSARSRFPQPQMVQVQKTGYLELMEALLNAGANPNSRITQQPYYFAYNNCGNGNCGLENLEGATPFWRATYSVDVDGMRLMMKYGADPLIPTQRGIGGGGARGGGGGAGAGRGGGRGGGRAGGGAAVAAADTTAAAAAGAAGQAMIAQARGQAQAGRAAGAGGGRGGGGGGGGGLAGRAGAAGGPPDDAAAQGGGRGGAGGAADVPAGVGVLPIHAAAGVGYGNGFAGNSHRHAPDGWMPALKYLVEELGADVNARDANGDTPLHHAAARGDNEMILYLVSKGADPKAVARNGRTTIDMANGPVQRLKPYPQTIELLAKMGAVNNHRCVGC
jgi:ankyrin repeat protein